jgi:hypothetical protein
MMEHNTLRYPTERELAGDGLRLWVESANNRAPIAPMIKDRIGRPVSDHLRLATISQAACLFVLFPDRPPRLWVRGRE